MWAGHEPCLFRKRFRRRRRARWNWLKISHHLVEIHSTSLRFAQDKFFFDPFDCAESEKILQKCAKSCLTERLNAICWCPAAMRIRQLLDVLLFGLMGEPVLSVS